MSEVKVNKISPRSGTDVTLGDSSDTFTVPSGVGLTLTDSTLLLPTTITSTTEVKTNKISPATGVDFTLGDSGDTFTVPSGATIVNSGTATGFASAAILQVKTVEVEDTHSNTSSDPAAIAAFDIAFTPTSASSKLCLQLSLSCGANGERMAGYFYDSTGTAIIGPIADAASSRARYTFGSAIMAANTCDTVNATVWFTPGDTTTRTIQVFAATETSNIIYINRTYSDVDTGTINNSRLASTFTITEYDGSLVTIS